MLRPRDIAERLKISLSKAYDLLSRNEIQHFKIGGSVRCTEEQLAEYLESCRHGRRPGPVDARLKPTKPQGTFKHLKGQRLLDAWGALSPDS